MYYDSVVTENKEIAADIWHLKLKTKKALKAKPGQFINIRVSETLVPFLRKPFSIFDATANTVEVVYKVIGEGTKLLSQKKKGDALNFLGPLGNTYPDVPKGFTNVVLVGGGTGIASLHFLAKKLKKKGVKVVQGARNNSCVIHKKKFDAYKGLIATEDGSCGTKGFVTDVLKPQLKDNTLIYACGPEPMLFALKKLADTKKNVKVFGSFEAYMGCGLGACLSCVIEVKTPRGVENVRVCKEGPVFDMEKIVI